MFEFFFNLIHTLKALRKRKVDPKSTSLPPNSTKLFLKSQTLHRLARWAKRRGLAPAQAAGLLIREELALMQNPLDGWTGEEQQLICLACGKAMTSREYSLMGKKLWSTIHDSESCIYKAVMMAGGGATRYTRGWTRRHLPPDGSDPSESKPSKRWYHDPF